MSDKKRGFILIDKQSGWTSHDVVSKLRGITGIKKIGHAGTLDPLATGLLIVAIGREATCKLETYMKADKVYLVTGIFGSVSTTYDADGVLSDFVPGNGDNLSSRERLPSREEFESKLNFFKGQQQQIPPMYSAKKIDGKKLYELARLGKSVERKPCEIFIYENKLIRYDYPEFDLSVQCSSGTYIRTLVHDIGYAFGLGAYVSVLRRIRSGNFHVDSAYKINDLNSENIWDKLYTLADFI